MKLTCPFTFETGVSLQPVKINERKNKATDIKVNLSVNWIQDEIIIILQTTSVILDLQ